MITSSNGNIFRVTGPLCGEFTGHRWIPAQRPVTRSFCVFFDLRLNKHLSKQSWDWWFQTPSSPLWRHCNGKQQGEEQQQSSTRTSDKRRSSDRAVRKPATRGAATRCTGSKRNSNVNYSLVDYWPTAIVHNNFICQLSVCSWNTI